MTMQQSHMQYVIQEPVFSIVHLVTVQGTHAMTGSMSTASLDNDKMQPILHHHTSVTQASLPIDGRHWAIDCACYGVPLQAYRDHCCL